MTNDWSKVKEVLGNVLALDLPERKAFLDNAGLSPEVRAEVESLAELETESDSMLEVSAVQLSREFVDSPKGLIGSPVGPYKIVSELGHGGMGAVYLAERADGKFDQRAAIKLLKREMNTAALRRHFDQEREILATLDHPNIARLLNAGTTDDGIPFIAMEYVDGSPIDDFCAMRGLDLSARLELFMKVCTAVEFAHRNLVVHRDLKPSNILVTRDGVPKLLDFGISKILSKGFEGDSATITRMGVMTPSYASPEQLRRESVTTLSDVYSLGVILFELLSGHRPFEGKENDLRAIYSAVLEQEPAAPSSIANTADRHPKFDLPEYRRGEAVTEKLDTAFKDARQTDRNVLPLLPQMLKGDLDNIVLKALRKEPERRYASAGAFADDIDRHLRGLTVTARPNTFSYRASKFAARNKIGVGAALVVLLAVIAGAIATLWQMREAQFERARAERRFEDVRALANSFLFEISPEIERLPGSTPAMELLVKRALEYLDSLAAESSDDPALLRELASAYEKVGDVQGNPYKPNVGDVAGAMSSYEKSRQIRESLVADGLGDAKLEGELAGVYKAIGDLESNAGDYSRSIEWFSRSLAIREKQAAASPEDRSARSALAIILRTVGINWFYDNNNKKAVEFYERSRDILEKLAAEFPSDDKLASEYAYSFVLIGEAQGWDGDPQGAAANLQKGLEMIEPIVARNPNDQNFQRDLNLTLNKRAENLEDLEQADASVELYKRSLAVARRMYDADPQSQRAKRDVAMTSKKLAQALNSAGRYRESLATFDITLRMFEQIRDADKNNTGGAYDVANTRFSIGETYVSMKDRGSAIGVFETAKKEFEAILAANPDAYSRRMSSLNLHRLGKCYAELPGANNLKTAVSHLKASLDSLNRMKADGVLGDGDLPLLEEIPALIAKIGI